MFSIIIPTLNNLKYLIFCIKSIKKNSKNDNEILVHVSEDKNNDTRNFLEKQNIKYTYTLCNETIASMQEVIIMNIFDILKTYILLGHFLKSIVKSRDCEITFTEWE